MVDGVSGGHVLLSPQGRSASSLEGWGGGRGVSEWPEFPPRGRCLCTIPPRL